MQDAFTSIWNGVFIEAELHRSATGRAIRHTVRLDGREGVCEEGDCSAADNRIEAATRDALSATLDNWSENFGADEDAARLDAEPTRLLIAQALGRRV
jgi:hypothetical protein